MAKVIERFGTTVDDEGFIHYDDRASTYEKAASICGMKLDRRRNYAIIDGEVCELAQWTGPCSGCSDDSEYSNATIGMGCIECGGTGKRRNAHWVPSC